MSGGRFDYDQYKIGQIAEDIQEIIERFPEELYHYKYPDNVIEKFKEAVDILKKAEIYAERIDWLLSGDDSEESFFKRLEEDLKLLNT
jgi:hypothetical protein